MLPRRTLLIAVVALPFCSLAACAANPPPSLPNAASPPPSLPAGPAAGPDVAALARKTFSHAISCPIERVGTREATPTPPPDIAVDPQRLALWQNKNLGKVLFAAEGCGQSVLIGCTVLARARAASCQVERDQAGSAGSAARY